ncbi:MAG: hypothetical protein HY747_06670 [Elusimicrobia bacterium]|nr:hypothetical protein [Elusimicrobiota bacterium]
MVTNGIRSSFAPGLGPGTACWTVIPAKAATAAGRISALEALRSGAGIQIQDLAPFLTLSPPFPKHIAAAVGQPGKL